jgi:uncharacterized protein YmfQ (DUF2313 family)
LANIVYTQADYVQGLKNYLPDGPAWPKDVGSVADKLYNALVTYFPLQSADAVQLIKESFGPTCDWLLQEWEASLGIPDSCIPDLDTWTIDQQKQLVAAKFYSNQGPTQAAFMAFAMNLGVPISIKQFTSSRFGVMRFGEVLKSANMAFTWQVLMPATEWTSYIQCTFQKMKPAHTLLVFDVVVNEILLDLNFELNQSPLS